MTAPQSYRSRLQARGLVRLQVTVGAQDRSLIRALAKRLAEAGPEATHLRATVESVLASPDAHVGGILAALRASPLVGADLVLERPVVEGRKVAL